MIVTDKTSRCYSERIIRPSFLPWAPCARSAKMTQQGAICTIYCQALVEIMAESQEAT